MSQPQLNAKFLNGQTKSDIISLAGVRLMAVAVPTASSVNGKTISFANVINGVEYPVRKSDGTAYSITVAETLSYAIPEEIGLALSDFKIYVNTAVTVDGQLILLGE